MKPRLLHPVEVVYQNVDTGATGWDPVLDEPTGATAYESAVTVQGQMRYFKERLAPTAQGMERRGDGYALMYVSDADNVKTNAKITSIGGRACEFYVIDKEERVHYRTSRMVRVYFETKARATV